MALAESFIAAQRIEEGIHHNCGIAAFYFNEPHSLAPIIPALTSVNHRGEEGVGVVGILPDGTIATYRSEGIARDNAESIMGVDTPVTIVLGHDRYSTSGGLYAWQPFCDEGDRIATAHNGNITNPLALIDDMLPEDRAILVSDTHALHKALNAYPDEAVEDRLRTVLPKLKGAFSLTIADRDTNALYLVRDPWGFRPLHMAPLKNGKGYMAASETVAFKDFLDKDQKILEVQPGQCLRIDTHGITDVPINFPHVESARCVFELVYLGSPASEIFGVEVNTFRKECGRYLADQDIASGFVPDVIVPIRDSGATATHGYSQKFMEHLIEQGHEPAAVTKLMPEEALVRNHYVRRTFIQPNGRGEAVADKFTLIDRDVRGKIVVLVDDSVVRGNTMTRLIQRFRDAGALEVHVRSAAPPIRNGCFYGVDFTGKDGELVAADRSPADVAHIIGADSIGYMDLDAMVDTAQHLGGGDHSFCTACFSGTYPVPINPDLLIGKAC